MVKIAVMKKHKIFIFLAVIFVLAGIITVPDYGVSRDEPIQRQHCIINYMYLFPDTQSNTIDLASLPNLKDYQYNTYGVAIQMPVTFIEGLFHFDLSYRQTYLLRHYYVFAIFAIASILFYSLLIKIFSSRKISVLGWVMFVSCPRIWAHAHYNIKDIVFLSLFVINIFCLYLLYEKRSYLHLVMLAISSAFCINSRVIGATLLAFGLVFLIIDDWKKGYIKKYLLKYLICGILSFGIYILISPASWTNVITYCVNVVTMFSDYTGYYGPDLYFGKQIMANKLPWHYLFVSIFTTIPIINSLYLIAGIFALVIGFFHKKIKKTIPYGFLILLFSQVAFIFAYVIIRRPTLYTDWRHFYYLYPIFVILAILFLKIVWEYGSKVLVKIVFGLLVISELWSVVWCCMNHPNEYVYYNPIVRQVVAENFEKDWWFSGVYDAYKYLLENCQEDLIWVYALDSFYTDPRFVSESLLQDRIVWTLDENEAQYFIESYPHLSESEGKGKYSPEMYDQIYDYKVDGYSIWTIYKKKGIQ